MGRMWRMHAVDRIDSSAIRTTYVAVLDDLPQQTSLNMLTSRLIKDIETLLPEVTAQAAHMHGEHHRTAQHVLTHALQILEIRGHAPSHEQTYIAGPRGGRPRSPHLARCRQFRIRMTSPFMAAAVTDLRSNRPKPVWPEGSSACR